MAPVEPSAIGTWWEQSTELECRWEIGLPPPLWPRRSQVKGDGMLDAIDVRRFTALDMHGTAGTQRRRRIIRAEFVIGCPAMFLLAVSVLTGGHLLFGAYILGAAANYLPLAVYSVALFRPGSLEAELAGVEDVRGQLKRAGAVQVLVLIPFVVALAAGLQLLRRHTT